jgi:hypothetical protein
VRHFAAGAPLEAGKAVTVQQGRSVKSVLWPAEGSFPEAHPGGDPEDPEQLHPKAGKPYPKGKAFELVPARDFREDEVVPEEELVSPGDFAAQQREIQHQAMLERAPAPPGRRQPAPPPDSGERVR